MNNQNLVQYRVDITPEQRRENARKAGIASGKKAHERKLLGQILRDIGELPTSEQALQQALEQAGLPNTNAYAMMLAATQRALRGDVEALRFIRDTRGEKPTESMQMDWCSKDVKSLDMAALSDEQLILLADRCEENSYDDE